PADAKRVSYPTITPREGSSCFNTYEAIAPATRRTFSKVKSSAMIARQPSVPNLIAVGRRSFGVGIFVPMLFMRSVVGYFFRSLGCRSRCQSGQRRTAHDQRRFSDQLLQLLF